MAQATTFGYLNPPSKASGIAVALFQKAAPERNGQEISSLQETSDLSQAGVLQPRSHIPQSDVCPSDALQAPLSVRMGRKSWR